MGETLLPTLPNILQAVQYRELHSAQEEAVQQGCQQLSRTVTMSSVSHGDVTSQGDNQVHWDLDPVCSSRLMKNT